MIVIITIIKGFCFGIIDGIVKYVWKYFQISIKKNKGRVSGWMRNLF